jgi:hypothetical protein
VSPVVDDLGVGFRSKCWRWLVVAVSAVALLSGCGKSVWYERGEQAGKGADPSQRTPASYCADLQGRAILSGAKKNESDDFYRGCMDKAGG